MAISGATALLLLDGREVGYATGVSVSETIDQVPVNVLGRAHTIEHEAVGVTVTLSASYVRILESSMRAQGFWPSSAGTPKEASDNIVTFPPMTALIYNHTQDKVIMSVEGCVPESRTTRVDQGSIMMADVSMRGTRLLDEQES